MTTSHSLHKSSDVRLVQRRKPAITSKQGPRVRAVFGGFPVKELYIPALIDDYNRAAKGGDRANQYRVLYSTQRRNVKWWQALFHGFLDIGLTNCLLIHKHLQGRLIEASGPDKGYHYGFRSQLVAQLWVYGTEEAPKPSIEPQCRPVKLAKGAYCVVCLANPDWKPKFRRPKRQFGADITNQAPKKKKIEASKTFYECEKHRVRLCVRRECWQRYHKVRGRR